MKGATNFMFCVAALAMFFAGLCALIGIGYMTDQRDMSHDSRLCAKAADSNEQWIRCMSEWRD